MRKYIVNLKHVIEFVITGSVFRALKNWPAFLLAYLGLNSKEKLTVKFKNGNSIRIRVPGSDKWTIHEIFLRDDYGIKNLNLEEGCVLDIGGNVGAFSILASGLGLKRDVYVFEPEPENFQVLQENIEINKLTETIKPFNMAVSNEKKTLKLHLSQENFGGHTVSGDGDNFIEVPCTSLENVFRENSLGKCFLLKMDVEGSEYDIFYSTPLSVFEKIKNIRMEYHDLVGDENHTGDALKVYFEKMGYTVEKHPLPFNTCGYLYCSRI